MNAVIYARYSSSNQSEQSIEGQLLDCHAYAKREGLTIIGEYVDRAISGKTDDRPDFQRMISDAAKKQFERIIVWKLDRFARNRYDSAIYKRKLKQYGVKVLSAMEGIGDNDESILLEAMLEATAEYYSLDLRKKIMRGLRDSAAKGQVVGGNVPLGYYIKDKKYEINEKQAEYVRWIFEQYAEGVSPKVIIAHLKERGVRTNRGTPIGHNYIADLIKNRKYIGEYSYNGTVVESGCPALIDPELFEKANQRLIANKRLRRGVPLKEEYLLHGKAFCGMCGALLTSESGTSRNGETHHYYICSSRKRVRSSCSKKTEEKGFLEWYVVEQTVAYVLAPEHIGYIAKRIVEEYEKEFNTTKIRALEQRIAALEAEIQKNMDLALAATSPKMTERYQQRAEQLDAEQSDIQIDLTKLKVANKIRYTVEEVTAWLRSFCVGDPLDKEFARKIIDTFLNSVYVYDDKIVIYYNVREGQQTSYIEPALEKDESVEGGSTYARFAPPIRACVEHNERGFIFVNGLFGCVFLHPKRFR